MNESNGYGSGIFGPMAQSGGIFGPTATDDELLDALGAPYVMKDGVVRDPVEDLLEQRRQRGERQRMLVIERFINELPEARRFLVDAARRRAQAFFDNDHYVPLDARDKHYLDGEELPRRTLGESAFRWARNTTMTAVGNAAGFVLYHAHLRHEMVQQETVERLGGPSIDEVHARMTDRVMRSIDKAFDRAQERLAKRLW